MLVKHAKEVAGRWVREQGTRTPGFAGAFFHGSTNWLPDDAMLPATSDLDIMVVLDAAEPPNKPGKLIYGGVMLEVSYLSRAELQSPEQILSQSHMAGSFRGPGIIADPTGELATLQAAVGRDYARRRWVRRRCEHARDKILRNLDTMKEGAPFHDQVMAWLFGTGVTTHVLLVAGLKNPTVRRRYVAAQELLAEYGRLAAYPTLLELLGCARLSRAQVEQHLTALSAAFDTAKAIIRTPFFFATDISDLARPVAIGGSQELIEQGQHREAIFWMTVTYSRCQLVFQHDAPAELRERFSPGYRRLLADLGISSLADLQQRADEVKRFLPQLMGLAEEIMAANPQITDD